jgi:hypothetical protein
MMGWPTDADIERHRINEAEREIHRAEENTKPKWTQGPWEVDFSDYPFCIVHGKKVICSAIEENDANLIAAAPELYEALETTRQALQMAMIDLCKMAAEKQEIYWSPLMEVAMEDSSTALRTARGE